MAKTQLSLKFKLVDNQSDISRKILDAIKAEINSVLLSVVFALQQQIRKLLEERITNSDTWKSLENGQLRAEFGLPDDIQTRLQEILDIWLRQIDVDYKMITGTSTLRGGISIGMLETDWNQVLSSSAASIVTKHGMVLPWLEWLLTYGDKAIIQDYTVLMKASPQSRSGMAIMAKQVSGQWRVPPQFSGTSDNNFITEILENMSKEIETMIEKEFTSRL